MQPIVNIIEIMLIASGLFFLTAAFLDGRRAPRRADTPSVLRHRGASGPAMLVPRTIRRSALD